jgi:soluble lytic murein transglycosylase-like protein
LKSLRGAWAAVSDVFTGVPAEPSPALPTPAADDDAGGFANRLSAHLVRRPGRLVVACLATVLGPAVVAQAGAITPAPPAAQPAALPEPVPTPIPGERQTWIPLARKAAATCPGLPSSVLVAIGHVESSLGLQTWTSSAGAVGPMQFLPSTWAAYGVDGDGDGSTDIMNPVDAVHGAARLLCANGGGDPDRLASALWNYNHSDDYVRHVIALSRLMPV